MSGGGRRPDVGLNDITNLLDSRAVKLKPHGLDLNSQRGRAGVWEK